MNQLNTSLWGDESFTAVAVKENFPRVMEIVAKDTAPPLYYIVLFIWTRIFGHSEVAIRSLSVLLYLGILFIVFLIAKKIWHKKTALIATLLTLANPFLFPFAFEGRMYMILVFTVTLSFYFFITKNVVGYALASAAALYSQHYAVLVLFFQFLIRLIQTKSLKKNWFKLIKPYLLIGVLYLPWVYPLYKQVTMVAGKGFWLGKPKIKDAAGLIISYLIGGRFIFAWQKFWFILILPILILKKWSTKLKYNFIFTGWVLFPILLAFLLSLGKTSIFYDRYLIFVIPGLMLLIAGGWRKISLPLILIFIAPFMWINLYYFTHPTKGPFRDMATYIKNGKKIFLINYNGTAHHLWESKYYGLEAPLYVPQGELPYYVGTAQMTEKDIVKIIPQEFSEIGVIGSEEPAKININDYHLESFQKFEKFYFSVFVKNEKI